MLACAAALVTFAVLAVHVVRSDWFVTSDLALTELRTRDVGGPHTPLVGVYSRYGWNHPGPLLFYVLAIPYRLLGSDASAVFLGGALVNAAAVVGALVLLWRRGGAAGLALGGLVIAVLARSLGGTFLAFPWNPFVVVLPMLLLALLVWSVAAGDHGLLPVAVVVASFVVQSHVGASAPAVALLLIGIGALVVDARRGRVQHTGAIASWAVGAALFVWVPPLIDEFRGDIDNLSGLWEFWTETHADTTGVAHGARMVGAQLSVPAPWMGAHERVAPFTGGLDPPWTVPVALVLLVAATVVAWRRRDRDALVLDVIALVLVVVGWQAAARVIDEPFPYLLRWTWVAGALGWLAIGWTALGVGRTVADRGVRRAAFAAATAAAGAAVGFTAVGAARAKAPDARIEHAMHVLEPRLDAAVGQLAEPILLQPATGIGSAAVGTAVLIDLVRDGVHVGMDPELDWIVGGHTVRFDEARTVLVPAADEKVDAYMRDPRFRLVALHDSLTPDERRYVAQREAALVPLGPYERLKWLEEHAEEWRRVIELGTRGDRAALFVAGPEVAGWRPEGG
jgi:hypothetical protein